MSRTPLRSSRRSFLGLSLLALLSTGASGCLTPRVDTQVDESFDASGIRTFAWGELPEPDLADGALDEVVRDAIEDELDAFGWQASEGEEPDVLVTYRTSVEVDRRTNDPFFDFYAAEQFERGTLFVELVDPLTGQTVWTGSASSELRLTAVVRGPTSNTLKPVQEKRDWDARVKVEAILGELVRSL